MKRHSQNLVIALTLMGFGLFFLVDKLYFRELYLILFGVIQIKSIAFLFTYFLVGIPIFVTTIYLFSKGSFIESLGLKGNIIRGIVLGFLGALPMLLGYALSFKFNSEITVTKIFIGSICAGFFEELYYRGFLFGILYRNTKLGFFPSIILCALIFGSVHLYQSEEFGTMIGIFFTTFMGAGLFAWLYAEWNFNLWVPISLHLFMNLFWDLFDVSGNALGGLNANVFRIITIILVVLGTVLYNFKQGGLEVNKKTLWMKHRDNSN